MAIIGIVPAAGSALRLQPLERSKEVLEIAGRPVMDFLVERMRAGGADEIVAVTRPDKDDVAARAADLGLGVVLGEPRSVSESILLGLGTAARDDVALIGFPDTIWQPVDGFGRLRAALSGDIDVVLGTFGSREPERSDVVVLAGDRVARVDVKPPRPQSRLVWGCAVARVRALDGLERHDQPGVLFDELARARRVAAVRLVGDLVDIGTPEALARAREELDPPAPPQYE